MTPPLFLPVFRPQIQPEGEHTQSGWSPATPKTKIQPTKNRCERGSRTGPKRSSNWGIKGRAANRGLLFPTRWKQWISNPRGTYQDYEDCFRWLFLCCQRGPWLKSGLAKSQSKFLPDIDFPWGRLGNENQDEDKGSTAKISPRIVPGVFVGFDHNLDDNRRWWVTAFVTPSTLVGPSPPNNNVGTTYPPPTPAITKEMPLTQSLESTFPCYKVGLPKRHIPAT